MLEVRLYTRRGCHLCDDVSPLLRDLKTEFDFSLEAVDIDSDPELASRFGCSIPIVTVDSGNQVAGRITIERLRTALSRAHGRRQERERLLASRSAST